MNQKIKKMFNLSVVFILVFGTLFLVAPSVSAVELKAGDLIKAPEFSAVYYYGEDGKRYVFPNQKTYNTWYSGFSGVVTITLEELGAIPIGGNITYRPGTRLVKITTDPKVYAVGPGGTLHAIDTEARAIALYGADWAQRVDDVPDPFFVNYVLSTKISSDQHPDGSLIEYANGKRYVISEGKKRLFKDSAFTDNSYFEEYIISTDFDYPDGNNVKAGEKALSAPLNTLVEEEITEEEKEELEEVAFILLSSNYSKLAANNTDFATIEYTLKNSKGEIATGYSGAVSVMTNDLLTPSTYSTTASNGTGSIVVTAGYKTGTGEVTISVDGKSKSTDITILSVDVLQPSKTVLKDLSLLTPIDNESGSGEEFSIPFNPINDVDYYIAEESSLENFNEATEYEISTDSCQEDTCYATFTFSHPATQKHYFRVKGVRNTLHGFWNNTINGNTVDHIVVGTDI